MPSLADEVRAFLSAHHLRLNTDLGQHFLLDESILDRIVEVARIEPTDTIVEIGPGIGILTRKLLEKTQNVIAVELDNRLIPLLTEFTRQTLSPQVDPSSPLRTGDLHSDKKKLPTTNYQLPTSSLTIIQGNALDTPMPSTPYKVVANIPYHITSPLLRHLFLESAVFPRSLTLLIQREVAEKICSPNDAGMLTILVALFGTPKVMARVPPASFLPPPKVDSAVLHIDCFAAPLADARLIERIFKLTKIGFSQKRKMLRNTLGAFSWGMELLSAASIAPERRAQTLSIQEWISLAHTLPDDAGA
ncbi:MAG: rRNA adenine dimethyltransferase family protein [Candidatus Peregrinibacteria bacterium]